ncbi:MAG: hypothetical protein EOM32_00760 [Spirochaetia bacterium]|nr:hypothetical protein [Spirochaetia bacterium]NCC88899.1 hypothetical protein [Spirochaetia bacterium]
MPSRFSILLLASLLLTFVLSKVLLSLVGRSSVAIKPELRQVHASKQGTPVVGGVAFTLGTFAVTLSDPHLASPTVLYPLLGLMLFALVGFLDDRLKQTSSNGDGLPSLLKLALQVQAALLLLIILKQHGLIDTTLDLGFASLSLGPAYYLLALLYILYFVNAINITDGLDALAAGSSLPMLLLIILFSVQRSESTSPALLGSLLAFLWFNRRPAKYFMGDCGSHALGGYLAISGLLLKAEVALFVASGLFLVELASSLIQIISIRRFGKKVFTIAPLHHAYELKGVKENRIVISFILVSWLFGAASLLLSR